MSSVGRVTSLDTDRIRTHFPALALGVAHFDGPGGSQTPTEVAEAVAAAMTSGVSNRGTITDAELRAERIVADARAALGDLLGADPRGVVFGRSMTALTFDLARTLSADWGPGDEIVVTRLDHDANIRPWVLWAERAGATVRWLGFDPDTAELDDLETVLSTRTRLVAVTGASNLFGTRPDVAAISRAAHEVDALVYVDGVHLAPHAPVDVAALGADLLACSPYKFFGPHLGARRRLAGAARAAVPRTSCCPPATRCRSGSSSARCPTSCWPASPPASTSSPTWRRATPPTGATG